MMLNAKSFALRAIAASACALLALACGAPPDGQGPEGAAVEPSASHAPSGHAIAHTETALRTCAPNQDCTPCSAPNASPTTLSQCPSGPSGGGPSRELPPPSN
jgi:hypothetical protein